MPLHLVEMIWKGSNPAHGGPEPGAGDERSIGSQVDRVLSAAEQAAESIREEAREWASAYTEESRRRADELAADRVRELGQMTDSLIGRAREVARQSDELVHALDEAGRTIMGAIGTSGPRNASGSHESFSIEGPAERSAEGSPRSFPAEDSRRSFSGEDSRGSLPAEAPSPMFSGGRPEPAPAPAAEPGVDDAAHHARLVAIRMAIAGSSREEIANRLYDEFEINDPTAILNEIWN